jgi:hypothetical protein
LRIRLRHLLEALQYTLASHLVTGARPIAATAGKKKEPTKQLPLFLRLFGCVFFLTSDFYKFDQLYEHVRRYESIFHSEPESTNFIL